MLHVGDRDRFDAIAVEEEQTPIADRDRLGQAYAELRRIIDGFFDPVHQCDLCALDFALGDRTLADRLGDIQHGLGRLVAVLAFFQGGKQQDEAGVAQGHGSGRHGGRIKPSRTGR